MCTFFSIQFVCSSSITYRRIAYTGAQKHNMQIHIGFSFLLVTLDSCSVKCFVYSLCAVLNLCMCTQITLSETYVHNTEQPVAYKYTCMCMCVHNIHSAHILQIEQPTINTLVAANISLKLCLLFTLLTHLKLFQSRGPGDAIVDQSKRSVGKG